MVAACLEDMDSHADKIIDSLGKSSFKHSADTTFDSSLMEALRECYNNANHWSTRRQILSIMADKVSFNDLKRWIPDISRYRFNIARHHLILHGRGSVRSPVKNTRMYVKLDKLEHFLTFITMQFPHSSIFNFGEKVLKLSSGSQLKIPNVVRTLIPEQTVRQYQRYCAETSFQPLSRSTFLRILSACSASVRKSLQGLD